MKTLPLFAVTFVLIFAFAGCSNEDEPENSQFLVVTNDNRSAGISIYEYPSKKFTPNFYTVQAPAGDPLNFEITAAAKGDRFIYLHTGLYNSQLRKIDVSTGEEIYSKASFISAYPLMAVRGEDVLVFYRDVANGKDVAILKMYDSNLTLTDSIGTENEIPSGDMTVIDDKLFYSVRKAGVGPVNRIMDLNTKVISSTGGDGDNLRYVRLNATELLVIRAGSYSIFNLQSMTSSQPVQTSIGAEYVAYDAVRNVLYAMRLVAQPAFYQYMLTTFNLTTTTATPLGDSQGTVVGPIFYDERTNAIITGDLKVFSTEGSLLAPSVGNTALAIFRK